MSNLYIITLGTTQASVDKNVLTKKPSSCIVKPIRSVVKNVISLKMWFNIGLVEISSRLRSDGGDEIFESSRFGPTLFGRSKM